MEYRVEAARRLDVNEFSECELNEIYDLECFLVHDIRVWNEDNRMFEKETNTMISNLKKGTFK